MFNPYNFKTSNSVRTESYSSYKEYSDIVNKQEEQLMTIRGLLEVCRF